MFQIEHDLIHRHSPLEDHPARIIKDKARHQAKYQVSVVGVFAVDLARVGRPPMLQDAKDLLDQVATRPSPQQAGSLDLAGPTEPVEAIFFGLVHDDHRHRPIGRTLSSKPPIATTGRVQTLLSGPCVVMHEVATVDFAPIFEIKASGGFALNPQGTLMNVGHIAHQLRITTPAIGHHHGRRQFQGAPGQSGEGLIQHGLCPLQFRTTACAWPFRVGPWHGKINGHDQLAIAPHHEPQHPINATDHALVLATVPVAHPFEGSALFAEDGIVDHRGELPAAARCRAHALGAAPDGRHEVLTELAQALEPGAFGQSPQKARGAILVPAAHTGAFMGTSRAKQSRNHEGEELAQELVLAAQATFDLSDQIIGKTQFLAGLMEGFDVALSLSLLALRTFLSMETTTLDGFGLFSGVSFGRGHGGCLRIIC